VSKQLIFLTQAQGENSTWVMENLPLIKAAK
jgi:hypothetical protein